MTDIIDTSFTRGVVVGALHVVTAHVRGFGTDRLSAECALVRIVTVSNLVEAPVGHMGSEVHVVEDRVIDPFDAIGVVGGKQWVVRSLDVFINYAVDDAQIDKIERLARRGTVLNELVLLIEVVVESWTVMTTITVSEFSRGTAQSLEQ